MKRKIISLSLALAMCAVGIFGYKTDVQAQEAIDHDVPISEIMTEEALIGCSEDNTWGVYLGSGISIINDSGAGKIGWGGCTYAARTCKVSISCIVERYSGGSWLRVTSASSTTASGLTAAVSKTTLVGSGYYYRVRSAHYAASDVSSSSTDALLM